MDKFEKELDGLYEQFKAKRRRFYDNGVKVAATDSRVIGNKIRTMIQEERVKILEDRKKRDSK